MKIVLAHGIALRDDLKQRGSAEGIGTTVAGRSDRLSVVDAPGFAGGSLEFDGRLDGTMRACLTGRGGTPMSTPTSGCWGGRS